MSEALINGVNLYYELKGRGDAEETVFFLNGVMASTGSWNLMLPPFEKEDLRIVMHDFRGQLKSEKPEDPWSFDDHVKDLKGLMDHLGIEKASFIGTSYGGEVAMYFGAAHPERCRSLSIIDSVSELDPLCDAAVGSWLAAAENCRGEVFYNIMLPWLYSRKYLAENIESLRDRGRGMKGLPDDYYRGQVQLYKTFSEVNITDKLGTIGCPAMVFCGEEDILKPPAFSKIIADRLPDSELVLLPECGHVAIFEKAAEISGLVIDFYKRRGIIRT